MAKNVIILYGGKSTEHDVSIITALQVYKKYKLQDSQITLCYISKNGDWYIGKGLDEFSFYKSADLSKLKKVCLQCGVSTLFLKKSDCKLKKLFDVDYVVNCCHGGDGENGNITALLEMCNIKSSTGCSSSLKICMDKCLTKHVLLACDIPTIDFFIIDKVDWLTNRDKIRTQLDQFDLSVVVKPSTQGSSVGVCMANTFVEFEHAVNLGFEFSDRVIVERAILSKREFNCCLNMSRGKVIASEIEEPLSDKTIIGFKEKYLSNGNKGQLKGGTKAVSVTGVNMGMAGEARKFPAIIPKKLEKKIIEYAKTFYNAVHCAGIVRIDFIYDTKKDKIYLSEANAIPGSLGYYFWGEDNILENVLSGTDSYWRTIFNEKRSTHIATIFKSE